MKTLVIIFAAAFTFIAGQSVSAQSAQRIQFEKGKNSAVVKGTTGEYGVSYVVRAKSGQKITITLTPATGVGIKVDTDSGDGENVLLREEKGGTYVIGLDANGDYTIFLGSTSGKSKAFTMTVRITKLADV